MAQTNEEKLVRHCKDKDMWEAISAVLMLWLFTGFLGLVAHWYWMLTWWGFFFIGLPYGVLLVWGVIRGVRNKYE